MSGRTVKEYTYQYRFSPRGMWHTSDIRFETEELARRDMEAERDCELSAAAEWRVVSREVHRWEPCDNKQEDKADDRDRGCSCDTVRASDGKG